MRLPRLRLSLRTLMLLVVAFVLGMATDDVRHRHDAFMAEAYTYGLQAGQHRENSALLDKMAKSIQFDMNEGLADGHELEMVKAEREKASRLADRCDQIRSQFELASYIPFAPKPDERIDKQEYYKIPIMPVALKVESSGSYVIGSQGARSPVGPKPR